MIGVAARALAKTIERTLLWHVDGKWRYRSEASGREVGGRVSPKGRGSELLVYDDVPISVTLDLRRICGVYHYVATRVPYVADVGGDEIKPPLATLATGGDCEDRAILVASTPLALGFPPEGVALADVDTGGDGEGDHAVALAQLPTDYSLERLAYEMKLLVILFTGLDPYRDFKEPPNVMLVPAKQVKGSDGKGYFVVIDPPDLTEVKDVRAYAGGLVPGFNTFSSYNIICAETVSSLLGQPA